MRTSLVALSAAVIVALSAGPAAAESWHARDRQDDVRSFRLDLSQDCERLTGGEQVPGDRRRDITRLAVEHGTDAVVVQLRLRDVGRHDRKTNYEVVLRTPDTTFTADVFPVPRGPDQADLEALRRVRDPESPGCGPLLVGHPRECPGLLADLDSHAEQLTLTVPRECLGSPAWVRVGAASAGYDYNSITAHSHVLAIVADWLGHADPRTDLLSPLGPRVHSS